MKKAPGAKKLKEKKTQAAPHRFKPVTLAWLVGAMAVTVSISAIARTALLHESAVEAASAKFEQLTHKNDNVRMVQQLDGAPEEPMPPKAKQATTREEATKIIAQGSGSNSAFTYDPYGRLVKIVEPDSTVRQFVYSRNKMCEERDGSGNVTKQFFDWGEIISGTKYFYTRDHLGSVREMTDINGNIVAQYGYDPFGRATKLQGSGPDSDFLFAGYFYHKASGLYITAHRVYSPKLGRWLSRDPIDDPGFQMMQASNPEPRDPGVAVMAAARGRQVSPESLVMAPIFNATHDPIMRRQLMNSVGPLMPSGLVIEPLSPDVNAYAYVRNNPVRWRDPSGLAIGMPQPRKPKHCPVHPPPPGEPGAPGDLYSCYDWCAAHTMTYEDYLDCCAWCDEHYVPDPE